ncbi:hypothetical protein [Rhizobium lentis]|uniref:Uncharacterized protein n=1 Tax=Rhizobium lentis TaxID=1138194 RepID=A0A9Q3QXM0_9HYPH|nr:hypothetical protein [Rhizobium lentis]MBX5021172.1 hypothetical protein [Rhizobium lentis]
MSISTNLQQAHAWAEVCRDPAISEEERQHAQLNEALFERDYLAESEVCESASVQHGLEIALSTGPRPMNTEPPMIPRWR